MMSLPPKRCGFSNEPVYRMSPFSRSTRFRATVVVPRSTAKPQIRPR